MFPTFFDWSCIMKFMCGTFVQSPHQPLIHPSRQVYKLLVGVWVFTSTADAAGTGSKAVQ